MNEQKIAEIAQHIFEQKEEKMPKQHTIDIYEFDELNEKAKEKVLNDWITFQLEQGYNHDINVQKAVDKAEENKTPWFAGEIYFDDNEDSVYDLARSSYYTKDGDFVKYIEI